MTAPLRLGIFERPGADFTLRRTLELLSGAAETRAAMAVPSRFVLLVPWDGRAEYIRCATVEELFKSMGTVWGALSRAGVRHLQFDRAVEPETERLIDEATVLMEQMIRPPAANDA